MPASGGAGLPVDSATAEAYEGKAKRVVHHDEGTVHIYFKDDATAFNGRRHQLFDGKGVLNSRISEKLLTYLEARDVPTHHIGRVDERTLSAWQVDIIPIETVVRFKVAGSLEKRTGLGYLAPCDPPITEMYYKRDDLGDPLLNDDHIALLGLADPDELETMRKLAMRAAAELRDLFERGGIDLVDLKLEFGRTTDGRVVLADEISPDTCRFRDLETGEILDKDLFRLDRGDLVAGYRTLLDRLDALLATGRSDAVPG